MFPLSLSREKPLSNVHCFRYKNRLVRHVAVRHGNATSVRDVVQVSLFLTLCSSNSLRFNDCSHELAINMKKLILALPP